MEIKNFFFRIGRFLRKHKWLALLIFTAFLVGGFFIWESYTAKIDSNLGGLILPEGKEPILFTAPYSGLKISEEQLSKRPIAVMIENHPDSRPQSGLNEADLVFETIAEGGITRFLALYHSQESKEIGPVRSTRSYYVEWADSYNALYAYVGGSQEALNLISHLRVADLNQFFLGDYYWRDNTRFAPHNVYTTTEKLRQAAILKKHETKIGKIVGYQFKKDLEEINRPEAQQFTVNYNKSYAVSYIYNKDCNCYWRSQLKELQRDKKTQENIIAKNVIVVFSQIGSVSLRNTTYATVETVGTGQAYIYQDGRLIVGTWKRLAGQPIRFYDANMTEVKLNSGTTWVNVVPTGTSVL